MEISRESETAASCPKNAPSSSSFAAPILQPGFCRLGGGAGVGGGGGGDTVVLQCQQVNLPRSVMCLMQSTPHPTPLPPPSPPASIVMTGRTVGRWGGGGGEWRVVQVFL